MRQLNNPEPELDHEFTNEQQLTSDRLFIQKHFLSNSIVNNKYDRNKYFTYSPSVIDYTTKRPSSKQSNYKTKPIDAEANNFNNDVANKFSTWPSHSQGQMTHRNSLTQDSIDLESFEESNSEQKPEGCFTEANGLDTDDRVPTPIYNPIGKDKIDSSVYSSMLPTPEEFINPVDKQIAAIFHQMSSNSSMLEGSTSDMDNNSFYNSPVGATGNYSKFIYSCLNLFACFVSF